MDLFFLVKSLSNVSQIREIPGEWRPGSWFSVTALKRGPDHDFVAAEETPRQKDCDNHTLDLWDDVPGLSIFCRLFSFKIK